MIQKDIPWSRFPFPAEKVQCEPLIRMIWIQENALKFSIVFHIGHQCVFNFSENSMSEE